MPPDWPSCAKFTAEPGNPSQELLSSISLIEFSLLPTYENGWKRIVNGEW